MLFSAFSCEKNDIGHFEEEVSNFSAVNTFYDDYNSTSPILNFDYLFHFSSNRNSNGIEFDLVGEDMSIDWNIDNGTLEIWNDPNNPNLFYLAPLFDAINTPHNELGPYSLIYRKDTNSSTLVDLIIYASDQNGNFDIRFGASEFNENIADTVFGGEIEFLNTSANELYPSFYGENFYYHDWNGIDISKIEEIIYSSDKEGNFNIYSVDFSTSSSLIQALQSTNLSEPTKLALSSSSEDKCPYVNGKLLTFSSNRPGGYGGFDLYYSLFENGSWSAPINFGNKINTGFDEYRPISLYIQNFDNNLLIFSSDRPGGKGGFDLYYTGIKQLIAK